jgi:choline dehydrogenase-like flavoprotein
VQLQIVIQTAKLKGGLVAQQYADPYDAVVIGAGMAGIVVAAKIAEKGINPRTRGRLRVALVERGPYFGGEPKPGYGHPLRRRMFTNITTEFREEKRYTMGVHPEGSDGPNTFGIYAASIVGGGSLHWAAETRHPHSEDYVAWQRETGVDWTEDNFESASEEIRQNFNIHERPDELLSKFQLDLRDAGKKLGFQVSPTTVAKQNCLYSGFCAWATNMCKYDARRGSFVAYLPVLERNGVEIIADADVQKIYIEKGRATGISFIQKGTEQILKAEKVIVSSGILGSPVLLMRSGYGSREDLGRNLVVENANVGRNIDGRPGPFSVNAIFDVSMSDGDFHDGGFHLFYDTTTDRIYDRLQFNSPSSYQPELGEPHQVAVSPLAPQFGREHKEFMRQICNPSVASLHRDEILKRGRLVINVVRPRQVFGRTNIRAELFYDIQHPSLERLFLQGGQLAQDTLRAMGAREVTFDRLPRRAVGFFAWSGSCRAGTGPKDSVVNAYGESHDIENLFVCDASIAPRCASQGYGAPTATVAAFISDRIVQRHFSAANV